MENHTAMNFINVKVNDSYHLSTHHSAPKCKARPNANCRQNFVLISFFFMFCQTWRDGADGSLIGT